MTTAANPLSIYSTPSKARSPRWKAEAAAPVPPGLLRTISHRLLCNDFQMGIAEHRTLSGVQHIRSRHAYPSFDWQWID